MDTIKSKVQWAKTKAAKVKEKTLDRLLKLYRDTQELRRKKAEGTATPVELKTLQRRMKRIKIAAAAIGITLAIIAAIAGGTAYRKYRKRERKRERLAGFEREREEFSLALKQRKQEYKARKQEYKALRDAVRKGDVTTVESFIDKITKSGTTMLHTAADRGHNEIVKALLDAGADPNFQNRSGDTALHEASKHHGNKEIVKALLDKGADPNLQNRSGNTALYEASAFQGSYEAVKVLLDAGADPNLQNRSGDTALHGAFSTAQLYGRQQEEIVQALLDAGANPSIQNKRGDAILQMIAEIPPDGFYNAENVSKVTALLLQALAKKRARSEMRTANPALMGLPAEVRMRIGKKVGVETPWTP